MEHWTHWGQAFCPLFRGCPTDALQEVSLLSQTDCTIYTSVLQKHFINRACMYSCLLIRHLVPPSLPFVTGKPLFPGTSTMNQIERIMAVLPQPSRQDIEAVGAPYALAILGQVPRRLNTQDPSSEHCYG